MPCDSSLAHVSSQVVDPVRLTENTTPVSTRALLLVLKNIKNNAEVDYKAHNLTKMTGVKGKCKMESINSWILKKSKNVSWTNKHEFYARNMWAHSKATTCTTVYILTKTAPRSKVMGVQVGLSLKETGAKAQTLHRLCMRS